MSRDSATVVDLVNAAEYIVEFVAGMDRDTFLDDPKTQSAVLYQFAVLGEAVKRLSPEFRTRHASIPWKQIAGMRDNLIHGYDSVEPDDVWDAATKDVPARLAYLERLRRTPNDGVGTGS